MRENSGENGQPDQLKLFLMLTNPGTLSANFWDSVQAAGLCICTWFETLKQTLKR